MSTAALIKSHLSSINLGCWVPSFLKVDSHAFPMQHSLSLDSFFRGFRRAFSLFCTVNKHGSRITNAFWKGLRWNGLFPAITEHCVGWTLEPLKLYSSKGEIFVRSPQYRDLNHLWKMRDAVLWLWRLDVGCLSDSDLPSALRPVSILFTRFNRKIKPTRHMYHFMPPKHTEKERKLLCLCWGNEAVIAMNVARSQTFTSLTVLTNISQYVLRFKTHFSAFLIIHFFIFFVQYVKVLMVITGAMAIKR